MTSSLRAFSQILLPFTFVECAYIEKVSFTSPTNISVKLCETVSRNCNFANSRSFQQQQTFKKVEQNQAFLAVTFTKSSCMDYTDHLRDNDMDHFMFQQPELPNPESRANMKCRATLLRSQSILQTPHTRMLFC